MQVQNSLISLFDVNGNCDMMQPFLTHAKKKKKKKVMKIKVTKDSLNKLVHHSYI